VARPSGVSTPSSGCPLEQIADIEVFAEHVSHRPTAFLGERDVRLRSIEIRDFA